MSHIQAAVATVVEHCDDIIGSTQDVEVFNLAHQVKVLAALLATIAGDDGR